MVRPTGHLGIAACDPTGVNNAGLVKPGGYVSAYSRQVGRCLFPGSTVVAACAIGSNGMLAAN